MSSIIKMKMSTNPRLLKDVLAHYKSTFFALKELIDNSIQANAKRIEINLIPSSCPEDSINYKRIESIDVIDDGDGVPFSSFDDSIMQIATENKKEGKGIGRFGALQIGKEVRIETVAYDTAISKYTKTVMTMTGDHIISTKDLQKIDFPIETEELNEKCTSYYRVNISDLYQYGQDKLKKKNKLSEEFTNLDNFKQALFENYPFNIFEGITQFIVNGDNLNREQFLLDTPHKVKKELECSDGKRHEIFLYFYKVNLKTADISIYFQIDNSGIKQSIAKYSYVSPWHTPDAGTWFVLVESDLITPDMMVDFAFADFGNESKAIQQLIKDAVDEFFKKDNRKFLSFLERLKRDKSYPYRTFKESTSLQVTLFNHTAYILELNQKLLENSNTSRGIIYEMVKKLIEEGNVEFLFEQVLKLSKESREKFKELLTLTDMDDVVEFSSSVATRTTFLNFLHSLCYGDISEWLKERSQLHKIVKEQLWIFGEEYTETTRLWSDTNLENNLEELHKKYFSYEPTEEEENLIKDSKDRNRDITDLFFYNKKKTGSGKSEVMIVELKAPSCAIADKEISQIERYRNDIINSSAYPKDKVCYKIILISSKLSGSARIKMEAASTWLLPDDPFLYSTYTQHGYDIKLYVMEWSALIEMNRKKLEYLSNSLPVKPEDVGQKFIREYPNLLDEKSSNKLNQRSLK